MLVAYSITFFYFLVFHSFTDHFSHPTCFKHRRFNATFGRHITYNNFKKNCVEFVISWTFIDCKHLEMAIKILPVNHTRKHFIHLCWNTHVRASRRYKPTAATRLDTPVTQRVCYRVLRGNQLSLSFFPIQFFEIQVL